MKHALQKDHWLGRLAVLATLVNLTCMPLQATLPAVELGGTGDASGQVESKSSLTLNSSDDDERDAAEPDTDVEADADSDTAEDVAPLELKLTDDPLKEDADEDGTREEDTDEADASDKVAAKQKTGDEAPQGDNELRPFQDLIKALPASDHDAALSLEAQQAKDQGECPGGDGLALPGNRTLDDLPLEQEEHPFDAPAAQSEELKIEVSNAPSAPRSPAAPAIAPIETAAQQVLHQRINMCLAHYFTHPENLAKRSPWAVMHTILPFGVETDIVAGNRRVNAVGWMCYNGVCKTQRMFHPTQSGFRTNVGPGVQGHEGQFLAVLAQSSVPRNFPILVGKTRYTVSDLIRYEMVTCREKSELTFKLIGLSHYLSPRQVWRDERGQTWNLEKLVREEIDQPVVGAACGGTHRLMGLSYALMMRRRYNEPINGHWARADVYVKDFIQYAWTLQNPDGSFSTEWFEGRANEPDRERKVQTTGHILEWLIFALPAEDLDDPRVLKAIDFILAQVYDNRDHEWPIGPRGHALRALALYNQRVFGVPTGQLKNHLAQNGLVKGLR